MHVINSNPTTIHVALLPIVCSQMTPMPSKAIGGGMWAADGGRRGEFGGSTSERQHGGGVDSTWESSAAKES